MTFWIIVFVILVIAAIVCLTMSCGWDGLDFAGVICAAAAFILLIIIIAMPLEYRAFENKFEIQKEHFEAIKETYGEDELSLVLVVDAVAANDELAAMQAAKRTYGIMSFVPKRVFDLKPICIE